MSRQSLFLVLLFACPLVAVSAVADEAGDKPGSSSPAAGDYYWHCMGGVSRVAADNCAFFPGAIMFGKDHRPVAWFGLIRQPKEKSKFLYLLLFKSPENVGSMNRELSTQFEGPTTVQDSKLDGTTVTGKTRLKLDAKQIETSYEAEIDRKTNALIKEALKIGGTEIKPGEPRVILVDLTQDKVSYRPVKVDLPDVVPEATTGHQTWAEPILRGIQQLKEKSPEVKSFLK